MDKELILGYIKGRGYCTRSQIGIEFGKEDPEIIDIHLSASVEKGLIRKVKYQTESSHGTLYYVPYHKEG